MIKEREELLNIIKFGNDIKKIINEWDPINLLYISPEDEYETEIREIRNKALISDINTKKLLLEIKNIFKDYFFDDYNSIEEIEYEISSKILEEKKKYKLPTLVENYKIRKIEINDIELYFKIKNIVNIWDPLKIMDISFSNEYCYEISEILYVLKKDTNLEDLRIEIRKIFKKSYNGIYNLLEKDEIIVANKILELFSYEKIRES